MSDGMSRTATDFSINFHVRPPLICIIGTELRSDLSSILHNFAALNRVIGSNSLLFDSFCFNFVLNKKKE